MNCPTFKVSVGFPVFGVGFTSNNQLILTGGGGASRSGVKNKLVSYKIESRRKELEEDASFEFEMNEDAPMSLDVHPSKPFVVVGVNESEENIKKSINNNCRVFKILDDKFELLKSLNTLESKKMEDYQRVIRFSQDGTLFATGTTDGKVNVFTYPEYEPLSKPMIISTDDEILDVDINLEKEKLTCVLRDALKLVNLRGKNTGQIVQVISSSNIVKNSITHFRAFRYGRGYTKEFGFAVLNGITKPGAYIVKYDAYSLEQLKVVKVSNKPITAFTLSQDGAVLAFGSADLSITLLDAQTFKTLTKVKDAHSFSITCIAISPDRRMIASASADNSCRIVSLPLQFPSGTSIHPLQTLLLACIVAGILLWLTTHIHLEPFFKPSNNNNELNLIPSSTIIESKSSLSTMFERETVHTNNRGDDL